MYSLSSGKSLVGAYSNDREETKREVLPVRVEKWVIAELEREAETNPLMDSRSALARAVLTSIAKELRKNSDSNTEGDL